MASCGVYRLFVVVSRLFCLMVFSYFLVVLCSFSYGSHMGLVCCSFVVVGMRLGLACRKKTFGNKEKSLTSQKTSTKRKAHTLKRKTKNPPKPFQD